MTGPMNQTQRMQTVIVERRAKRVVPRDNIAPVPPTVPLNPAIPSPTRLKLKSTVKMPAPRSAEPLESVPAPPIAPQAPVTAPPPDPEVLAAKQAKQKWWTKQAALRARLRDLSPKLFGDEPVPLMRKIDRVLIERLGLVADEDLSC